MTIIRIIIAVISSFLIGGTAISLLRLDYWQVRVFDFPRIQIIVLLVIMMLGCFLTFDFDNGWQIALFVLLSLSLLYQLLRVYRYTFLSKKQVNSYSGADRENAIAILVSNVLQTNRHAEKLLELVDSMNPDLLLTLESNQWWQDQLAPLEKSYPYRVPIPLENLYGMHLYSKFELIDPKVNYLIQDDIPSIDARVKLKSGKKVQIYCLHPMPPSPTESPTSTNRDGELLLIGKKLKHEQRPALVFGDLNDVAWSSTTTLFQKISGLLDPRIGRGFFNTFNAKYALLRWPLDHIFHSDNFELIDIKRLPSIGSDHFPIYIQLHYRPGAENGHEEPEADQEEEERAEEKIEKAKEN